nr:CDGSH iron-sulfur domain-containing protein 3, mitochondrial-like [Onthophagus taurus]XP_022912209.1 CDGSH iron-sulfur domain-containing protein 3, mitochondrial-like [Onthophagus taurus]
MVLRSIITKRVLINILRTQKVNFSNEANIPKNVLTGVISADKQPENGIVYDKKPFKMRLETEKKYSWCLCGRSKNQPLCDGTHKIPQLKIKQKPIRFQVEKTKDYWLCNCKQTNNRPFCDGTHKTKAVQEATSTIK